MTLHSFYSADGSFAVVGLIQATNGDFCGTTSGGGAYANQDSYGWGTIFQAHAHRRVDHSLHLCPQTNCTDGGDPSAGLVQGADGNFYGTTLWGGENLECELSGCGTVFKITSAGSLTTLYSFCAQGGHTCTNGADAVAGLVEGTDGNFYGTTLEGGADGYGTIY